MSVTVDTNVLVRYTMRDDPGQAEAARRAIAEADVVCIPVVALCEYVWVLRSAFNLKKADIRAALGVLLGAENVRVDSLVVTTGLAMLDAGGDFADGVIGVEGRWLGGDEVVTFDRQAAELLPQAGVPARYLG